MKKTIRLTESDLIRVIKKIIKENDNERFIANKVESKIETPQIERTVDNILSNLSNSEINDLKNLLSDLGIDETSSAMEVHNKIENEGLSHSNSEEMTEEDEMDNRKNLKNKVAKTLHSIGAGNIAAWGGVPAAIIIGAATGMPLGFAISWGVTGLLMGIAKALNKEN